MKRQLRNAIAALAMLITTLTIAATPAHAITEYCNQHVAPVTLSLQRTGMYTVKITTSAPINSTAKFYERPGTSGSWTLLHTASQIAGVNLSWTYNTSAAGYYEIGNVGDTGQVWTDSNGDPVATCYSPAKPVS